MKVKELISRLQQVENQDASVYIYVSDLPVEITENNIDDSFEFDSYRVDINLPE